ncbi:MAG: hypothetical protein ACOYN0_15980 [Phycisphaerales bacterium]
MRAVSRNLLWTASILVGLAVLYFGTLLLCTFGPWTFFRIGGLPAELPWTGVSVRESKKAAEAIAAELLKYRGQTGAWPVDLVQTGGATGYQPPRAGRPQWF